MKKGISLIVLVITIIVLAILVGIVSIPGSDVLSNSKLANFYENMTKIQDAVTSYKMTRGHLPIKDNSQVLTYDQVLSLVSEDKTSFLSQEIISNSDNNSEFYYIDVNKIGIESLADEIDDTKLICNIEGNHVYLLEGFYLKEVWYFSVGKDI